MGSYSFNGSVQLVTVARGATFSITAYGAQGGASDVACGGGAMETGQSYLSAGEKLRIYVGGRGAGSANGGGGGGGGTFISANVGVGGADTCACASPHRWRTS